MSQTPKKMSNLLAELRTLSIEELVMIADEISKLQKEKLESKNSLGNSILENHFIVCPKCCSTKIWKNGIDKYGKQNYICAMCKDSIRATHITVYHSTKKHLFSWNQYLNLLLKNQPLNSISESLNINKKTAFLWRHKIMRTLSEFDYDIKLSGKIWIDEFQISTNYKGRTFSGNRPQRYHGKDPVNSVNDDIVLILLAIDENDNIITEVAGIGKILKQETANKILENRIVRGSTIVTDFTNAYNQLVVNLELNHIKYKSVVHSEDILLEQYPMNDLCSNLAGFLYKFHGVKTKYLQNYLDLFRFEKKLKYTTEEFKEKILQMFDKTVSTRIKLKLRDLYKG